MEKRPNCYNYIFSKCMIGDRCPMGHVIVRDKEEYMRRLENSHNQLEIEEKILSSNLQNLHGNKGRSRRHRHNNSYTYNFQEF